MSIPLYRRSDVAGRRRVRAAERGRAPVIAARTTSQLVFAAVVVMS
jgi:hypothetical protein